MHTRALLAALVLSLASCGGGDDGAASDESAQTGGDETAEREAQPEPLAEEEDAEPAEEEDGMSCLAVSRCHSFANQDCTLVDADGNIQDEAHSGGSVERACPGERGVGPGVHACFDYVEISQSCRRRPALTHPSWPCGRTDTERCAIVM